MLRFPFRSGRFVRRHALSCALVAFGALLASTARAQAPALAEAPPIASERVHRALLMLELSTAPADIAATLPYVQGGQRLPVFVVRPPMDDWRQAKELAATFAPGPGTAPAFTALDRVVFALEDGATRADATALLRAIDPALGEAMTRPGRNVFVVDTSSAAAAFDLADRLAALPGTRFAHPDMVSAKALDGEPRGAGGEVRVMYGATDVADGATLDFGDVLQNDLFDAVFTIHNDGGNSLAIDTVSSSGDFTVVSQTGTTSVPPGGSAAFTVRMTTTTPGAVAGAISFLNNDTDENPFDINLIGNVTAGAGPAEVEVSADGVEIADGGMFSFGATPLTVAVDRVFRISNMGGDDLTVGTVSAPAGFTVLTQPTPNLPGNTFTEFTVRMLGTPAGDPSGVMFFLTSDADENPYEITISGTVEPATPAPDVAILIDGVLQANGATVPFGVTEWFMEVQRDVEVRNTGVGELRLLYVRLPPGYSIRNLPAQVIPVGESTTIELSLDAECPGAASGEVFMLFNVDGAEEFRLNVSGFTNSPAPSGGIDDTMFGRQWHHLNTGQQGGTPGYDIRSLGAWETTLGAGAIVAMLDSGIQPEHPEYAARIVGQSLNDFDYDDSFFGGGGSHGTCVAGLIASEANYCGGRGVAPEASIFTSSIFNSDADMAMTMYDANAAGASIHTNSWSYIDPTLLPDVLRDAIVDLSANGYAGKGLLILFSSGNDDRPAVWRSALLPMPETMIVGAMSNLGRRSNYSNGGPWLDVTGPSSGGTFALFTTDVTGASGYNQAQSFQEGDFNFTFGGTSGSTPIVAGVAALVRSVNPDLEAQQVRRLLRHTAARDLVVGPDVGFDPLTKFSDAFGYGLVDATAAVDAATESTTNGGLTWPAPVTNAALARIPTGNALSWDVPSFDDVGAEHAGTLVVAYSAGVTWEPVDGENYDALVGGSPNPGVTILASGPVSGVQHMGVTPVQRFTYAIYAFNGLRRHAFPVVVNAFPIEPEVVFMDDMEGEDPGWMYVAPEQSPRGIIKDPDGVSEWERGAPNSVAINLEGLLSCNGAPCNPVLLWGSPIPMPPSIHGFCAPHSGQNVVATDLDGYYAPGTTHYLVSPVIDLTNPDLGSYSLSFWELLDVEGGGSDMGRVRILDADTGTVIRTLLSQHQRLTYEWRQQWFDLRNQRGRRIQLLFALEANEMSQFSGWFIDDVRIGASEGDTGPPTGNRPRRIILPGYGIPGPEGDAGSGGDINHDDIIDIDDVAALVDQWGESRDVSWFSFDADLDGNGRIGAGDLVILLAIVQEGLLAEK